MSHLASIYAIDKNFYKPSSLKISSERYKLKDKKVVFTLMYLKRRFSHILQTKI